MKASPHRNNTREVIGGDLSNYQFMSPRTFFLCHYCWQYIDLCISNSYFQVLFGNLPSREDYERWHMAKGSSIF
ncbi:hypothetical protein LguiB_006574 [Lonicera macranthoides]